MKIEPLSQIFLIGGPTIKIYGRKCGDTLTDWNLHKLHEPHSEFHHQLKGVCRELSVRTLYAPRPTKFNKRIAGLNEFSRCYHLDFGNILTGVDADGIELPPWHGFLISPADCFTTILWSKESRRTLVFHSGRDSIICWHAIKHKLGTHMFETVVKNALGYFPKEDSENLRFYVTCGIGGEHFTHPANHPTHGERNRELVRYLTKYFGTDCFVGEPTNGRLQLRTLIARQMEIYGKIDTNCIWHDRLDTWGEQTSDGDFALWSYRRANGDGDSLKRNLVVVTNTL